MVGTSERGRSLIHHAKRVNSRGGGSEGSAGSDLFCGADAVGAAEQPPFQRFAPDPEMGGGGVGAR